MRATVDGIGDHAVGIAAPSESDQTFEGIHEALAVAAAHRRAAEQLAAVIRPP